MPPDEVTKAYVEGRFKRAPRLLRVGSGRRTTRRSTAGRRTKYPLMVAKPHLPSNTQPAEELNSIGIDQVVIGSCTNGRIEDLRQAAEVLRGRKVHKDVRCIIIPATQAIWRQANDEGLFDVFLDAEAVVSAPTCGPCLGGHMGVLAEASVPFPPPIATLSAVWVIPARRSIWRDHMWPPPAPLPDISRPRTRSARRRQS